MSEIMEVTPLLGQLRTATWESDKEELIKCANEPFWVHLRWFLFITFWFVWASMLAGTITMVFTAPKCIPLEQRSWWEEGPLSEVFPNTSQKELEQLKEKGVQGVIVMWHQDAYIPLNQSTGIKNFLQRAKDADTNVIIELNPTRSWNWFTQSEDDGNGEYHDYYVWRSNSSVIGNSDLWKFSKMKNKFYLLTENIPQLNFTNPKVVDEFSKIIINFLDAGVKGIRLKGVPSLFVKRNEQDVKRKNEVISGLNQWRGIVKNKSADGPFMLAEDVMGNLENFKFNNILIIDLPIETSIFNKDKQLTAVQLNSSLCEVFSLLNNTYWPLWQITSTLLQPDVLDITSLLLPGTILVNNNSAISQELLSIRKSPSVMYGNTVTYSIVNNTVFAYGRWLPGNPTYLFALNPTNRKLMIDFPAEISTVPAEITVQYYSNNYNEVGIEIEKKLNAHNVPLSPESAIVFSYAVES